MNKQNIEDWVIDNFPYALHSNPDMEYSREELNAAKRCIDEKDLKRFDEDIQEPLFVAVAILIRSIINYKSGVELMTDEKGVVTDKKPVSYLFHVMQSFIEGNITEVVFRGHTNDKIVLNGSDVEAVKNMFLQSYAEGKIKNPSDFNNLIKKTQKLKSQAITEKKHITIYRNELAATIDRTLSKVAPGNNHKIIGYILNETDMIDTPYTGSIDNGTIQNLIKRGNGQIE